MTIAGIDYSLRGPSICIFKGEPGDAFCFESCVFYYLTDVKKYAKTFLGNIHGSLSSDVESDISRYDSISSWGVGKIMEHNCSEVGLEGYSYGSKGKVFHIAENTGVLKYKLWQERIPIDIVAPTTVKKEATGKGNADKKMMHKFFFLETGQDLKRKITPLKKGVTSPISDVVDSYYICKCLYRKLRYDTPNY
ncbi:MAG: hypothetical protein H8D80_00255 [Proteobacteria bacterium]|nr:hypothetical protein [Pseudomonadota bacterium]